MKKIQIFTDGAIHNHGQIGGWGAIILLEKDENKVEGMAIAGNELNTTSNRMELTGVIEALTWVEEEFSGEELEIELTSDSQYVVYGASRWMDGWKENDWHKVKNLDLWLKIDEFKKKFKITWLWIRGHAGHKWNELADKLATSQYKEPVDFCE